MNSQTVKDIGYFILRFGLGAMIARHGWPKITGGVSEWEDLGKTMADFGINFVPVFFGFCAALFEFAGGICIALGFFFRPACIAVLIVMIVAFASHIHDHDSFGDLSESAELGIAYLALLLMGPGKYSLSVSVK